MRDSLAKTPFVKKHRPTGISKVRKVININDSKNNPRNRKFSATDISQGILGYFSILYTYPLIRSHSHMNFFGMSHRFLGACACALFSLILLLGAPRGAEARSVNLPSPQCHPSVINSMPPRIRKICDALSTIWEYSDAMQNYLDEREEEELLSEAMEPGVKAAVEARRTLQNPGFKRNGGDEPDHVFLRFGKRG